LLAAIIVGSIYLERWLEEKARQRKEKETSNKTVFAFIINDLRNKLRFIEESNQPTKDLLQDVRKSIDLSLNNLNEFNKVG
jgi:hypothetical protein